MVTLWAHPQTTQAAFSLRGQPKSQTFNPVFFSFLFTLRWMEWNPGFPLSIDAKCHKDLPRDIQFDSEKGVDFVLNYSKA